MRAIIYNYKNKICRIINFSTNTDSFKFLVCVDELPSGYGFDCIFTCKNWANEENCDNDWSAHNYCFNGVNKDGKIKDSCKLSCGTCSVQHS